MASNKATAWRRAVSDLVELVDSVATSERITKQQCLSAIILLDLAIVSIDYALALTVITSSPADIHRKRTNFDHHFNKVKEMGLL